MMETAHQVAVEEADKTPRGSSRLVTMGLRVLDIGIPRRNLDHPSQEIDLGDGEPTADLLMGFARVANRKRALTSDEA